MQKYVTIKVNKDLGKHKAGDQFKIPVDKNGMPTEFFWRKRLKDAKYDECCEIVDKVDEPKLVVKMKPKPKAKSSRSKKTEPKKDATEKSTD